MIECCFFFFFLLLFSLGLSTGYIYDLQVRVGIR